jgi:hypothetical protein
MKLSNIVNPKLKTLLEQLALEKLPLKTAFKLKDIIAQANKEFLKYDELRIESVKKFALKDDKGELILDSVGNASFDQAGAEEFIKQLNEVTSLEIDIGTIKLSELGQHLNLSVADLDVLDGLVIVD